MSSDNQYQELSLVDLSVVWIRYWKLAVIAGALLFSLVLLGMSFLSERYESQVYVQLASMQLKDKRVMFVTAERVANQLKAQYGLDSGKSRPLPRLEKVNFDAKGEGAVIKLLTLGETAGSAQQYAQKLADKLQSEHQPLVDAAVQSRQQEVTDLQRYIKRIESDSSQSSQVNLSLAYSAISQAQREIASVRTTGAIKQASLPDQPSAPKKLLIVVAGFVLACGVALVLPFLLDFLRQVRVRLQQV